MRSKRNVVRSRVVALLLCALLIGGQFSIYADGGVGAFLSAAALLGDTEATYAARKSAEEAASVAYAALSDEEKENGEVIAAKEVLDAEREAIAALAAAAENFLSVVGSLANVIGLSEKQAVIAAAQVCVFEDVTYPGIDAALATLAAAAADVEATIAACEDYIDLVYAAKEDFDAEESYSEILASITAAGALAGSIDESYEGIAAAKTTYRAVANAMETIRIDYENYLTLARDFLAAENYAEMTMRLPAVERNEKIIAQIAIPDYPEVEATRASVAARLLEMDRLAAEATVFVAAVAAIGHSGRLAAEISAALRLRQTIDVTVPDAYAINGTLESLARFYGDTAAWANAEMAFLFGAAPRA